MRQPYTLHRLGLGIALALLAGTNAAFAIEQDQPFLMESWTLAPGTVFEILATSGTPDQQVTWSLTKADGTFVQADRGPLFRERFVAAGDFLLRGEVAAADRTPLTQRTFAIHIVADAPVVPAAAQPLVETDPPSDANGIAILDTNYQTVLLRGTNGATNLTADFNSDQDADGDGDPTNDPESRGTFFEAESSSLRIWFTDGNTNRTITVRGTNAAGPATQTVRLSSGGLPTTPVPEQPLVTPSGLELIQIEDRGNGTYAFSVDPTALSADGRPLLFHWDFGDGRQSMLDRPVHSYAANGAFTVILRVRDLTTTEEVLHVSGILPVSTIAAPSTSSSPPDSTSSSSAGTGTAEPSSSGLKTMLMIVAGLLLAVGAGFGIVLLIGKVVRRRLDAGPEIPPAPQPAKKTTPSAPPSLDLPPPMAVIDAEPTPETPPEPNRNGDTSPSATPPAKLSELSFREEEAPSWLKQGHEEAEKRGHTVATAAPSLPIEPTAEAPAAEKRPLPPWLEPAPPAVETTPPPTSPAVAPTLPSPALPPKAETPKLPEPPPPPPPAPVAEPPVPALTEEVRNEELTPAERERRRKKRARYRANKKKREEETAGGVTPQETAPAHEPKPDVSAPPKAEESPAPHTVPAQEKEKEETDEPIALIRADNISQD